MPSYHEGLPIALLEALSYNLKVLVSDIPANLEVGLRKDNYFKTGNIKELTEKLNTIMQDERSNNNYDLSKYNWDRIAVEVKNLYDKL